MARSDGGVAIPLVLLLASLALCGVGCNSATAPEPAGPVYDFSITYQRTAIVKAENSDPTELFIVVEGAKIPLPLAKIDDYTFTSEVKGLRVNSGSGDQPYAVYVIDPRRFESETVMGPYDYGRPHSVGDIFIFKSKLTGEETRLMNIVPNTFLWNLPAKCFPRMARFRLFKGGTFK